MISLYLGLIRTRDAAVVWESGEIATTGSVQMPQPTIEKAVVHAVDDDSLRRAVDSLGRSVGFETRTGGSAQQFLDAKREDIAGCLVLDVRPPGMRGLDLKSQLAALGIRLLVILVAGHGDEGRQTPRRLRAGLYQGVIPAIARRIGRKRRCVHPQGRKLVALPLTYGPARVEAGRLAMSRPTGARRAEEQPVESQIYRRECDDPAHQETCRKRGWHAARLRPEREGGPRRVTLQAIVNEPGPKLIVAPPLPDRLAQVILQIQYRVENLHILPLFGTGVLNVSPRVGHLHIAVDDLPWHWADASDHNTVDIVGLPSGQHKVLVDATTRPSPRV